MKKIAFLSILTGLFMVGCTEMAQPADPQSNAQEELVTITGAVTATAVPTIDLAKVEGDSVKVANVATEITAPEGTELKCYLTLNETVEYEVPADTAIVLPVAELQALVEEAELLEDANDEYQSMLSENDERAFMERYAVEVLDYAYPNERRFYDTTGN